MCQGPKATPNTSAAAMSALSAHSKFFDHLVELVPAKYYLDAGAEDRVNLKYMKKSLRDEAKAQFKLAAKAAKRSKLDPDQAKTTLQLQKEAAAKQQQRAAQNGAAESDSDDEDEDEGGDSEGASEDEEESGSASDGEQAAAAGRRQQQGQGQGPGAVGQLAIPTGKPPSREELRERLQKKLEDMRKQRKAEEQQRAVQDARQWRDKSLQEGRKKVGKAAAAAAADKQQKGGGRQQAAAAAADKQQPLPQPGPGGQQQQQQQQAKGGKQQKRGRGEGDEAAGLSFNKLDFGPADPRQQAGKKRRKASKAQLLAEATAKQAAAGELGRTEEGKAQLAKEAWGAALQRAKGDKVLDDPRLLKKSMKKESKLKAKKAAAWQDRLKKQTEQQQAKQQKRRDNIDGRIKAKKDKKIQKRENKLLRAGFEGRKQGFIDTPKRPAAAPAAQKS